MTEVSNEPATNDLRVMINTLYADRPDGPSVSFDRLTDSPDEWLRDNGVFPQIDNEPVIVMLDVSTSRFTHNEYNDCVALHGDNDRPLLTIDRAIAALQMARAALTAAGQADFIPKIDSTLYTCPGCGAKVIGHPTWGDPSRAECAKDAR